MAMTLPSRQSTHTYSVSYSTATRRFFTNLEFKYIKLTQILCGIYILTVTFTYRGVLGVFGGARDPQTGFIIDPNSPENTEKGIIEFPDQWGVQEGTFTRAIVAENNLQMVLLGLSRFSGFFMYPAIVLVFWTKFRAIQSFIARIPFVVFTTTDTHVLHVYCGWIIMIDSCFHTIFHLSRWANQGNLYLVFGSRSGLTGFIVIISTFIIVMPMTCLKQSFRFEVRKYAHYLFWIFALAMCFHAPFQAFPNGGFCAFIFPTLIIIYLLDAFYVKAFMTERIDTVKYETNKSGTQLTMAVSKRFTKTVNQGGYGYIMFEWIDKHQWHAFSIYEDPLDHVNRRIFIAKNGDWTSKVHQELQDRNSVRPVWIQGPFPSPYNSAIHFDNMVLVASGIGITPALSAIEAYRDSRRVNLVWAVREAAMLVFFLKNAKLDHKGFNLVFYTGKDPLPETIENFNGNANLQIVRERPNLASLLPNMIRYIDEHGKSQHEEKLPNKDELALALVKKQAKELEKENVPKSRRWFRLSVYANELGYDLPELIARISSGHKDIVEKMLEDPEVLACFSDDGSVDPEMDSNAKNMDCKMKEMDDTLGENTENTDVMSGTEDTYPEGATKRVHPMICVEIPKEPAMTNDPEGILDAYQARCSCGAEISCPYHRHSIWKTNDVSTTSSNRGIQQAKLHKAIFASDFHDIEQASNPNSMKQNIWEANPGARCYVHAMSDSHLKQWGFLYCGGRNKLLESLVKESTDLKIPLHQEAFDW